MSTTVGQVNFLNHCGKQERYSFSVAVVNPVAVYERKGVFRLIVPVGHSGSMVAGNQSRVWKSRISSHMQESETAT